MTNTRALFLCRGSYYDGLGHVVRSKSVSRVMKARADIKLVVIGDSNVDNLLLDFPESEVVATESEAIKKIEEFSPQLCFVDLINLERPNMERIAELAVTVGLSPIFHQMDRLDLLFHRTEVLDKTWPTGPEIRSGLEYTVLGEHCTRISESAFRRTLDSPTLSVAVSMGGTDSANKTLQMINTIKRSTGKLLLWVLLGEGYAHSYQDLVEEVGDSPHEIILVKTRDSMWRILETCAVAVLAGGTTTYEAAYAGLPSLNSLEAPEHEFLIRELVDARVCDRIGDSFAESLENVLPAIDRLGKDRRPLLDMHLSSRGLIDASGSYRIVEESLEFLRAAPAGS